MERLRRDWETARQSLLESIARGDGPSIVQIVRAFHQEARTYGEAEVLGEWGTLAANSREANQQLQVARAIGDALRQTTGESMLADAVTAIDRAAPAQRAAVASGHAAYYRAVASLSADVAEDELRRAESLFRNISPMAQQVEYVRARLLLEKGRTTDASEVLLKLLQRERTETPLHRALIASIQSAIASCHAAERRWDDAVDTAMDARRVFSALGEITSAATADALIADVWDYLGRSDHAWAHRVPAFRMISIARDHDRLRKMLAAAIQAEIDAGHRECALSLLDIETRIAQSLGDRAAFASALALRSRTLLEKGDFVAARADLRAAREVAGAEAADSEVDMTEALLVGATDPKRSIALLTNAIDTSRQTARSEVPRMYFERGRLFLALGDSRGAERDWRAGILAIEAADHIAQQPGARSRSLQARHDLFDHWIQLLAREERFDEAFQIVEKARRRELFDLTGRALPRPAVRGDVSDVRILSSLLARGTTVVQFYVLPDALVRFTVDQSGFRVQKVAVTRDRLLRSITLLSKSFEEGRSDHTTTTAMYDLLFRDVDFSRVEKLIVIPDGELRQVPFAALYDIREQRYLIEKVVVSIAPSVEMFVLSALRDRLRPVSDAPYALVVGSPAIQPKAEYGSLNPLPFAEAEARQVAALYPQSTMLSMQGATISAFVANAPAADVIHFAGHAVSDELRPENSRLLFAPEPSDDGTLNASEIARLNLDRVHLVVLATCSTMPIVRDDIPRKPDIVSSFLAAGSANVVTSTGPLSDAIGEYFFTMLHESIRRGSPVSVAVRDAQLRMMRSGNPGAVLPASWGLFEVVGGEGRDLRNP